VMRSSGCGNPSTKPRRQLIALQCHDIRGTARRLKALSARSKGYEMPSPEKGRRQDQRK